MGPTERTVNRQVTSEGGPIKVNLGVILFPDLIIGILKSQPSEPTLTSGDLTVPPGSSDRTTDSSDVGCGEAEM